VTPRGPRGSGRTLLLIAKYIDVSLCVRAKTTKQIEVLLGVRTGGLMGA